MSGCQRSVVMLSHCPLSVYPFITLMSREPYQKH